MCYCTAVKTAYLRRLWVVEIRLGRRACRASSSKNTMTGTVESPGQGGCSGRYERRQKRLTKRPWPGGEGPLEIASHSRVPGATAEWLCSSAEQVADQRQMMSLSVGEGSVAEVPQLAHDRAAGLETNYEYLQWTGGSNIQLCEG